MLDFVVWVPLMIGFFMLGSATFRRHDEGAGWFFGAWLFYTGAVTLLGLIIYKIVPIAMILWQSQLMKLILE